MARPSTQTDQRLLAATRELIEEVGIGRVTLRAVAGRAGVNLGMIHYHFGSKDALIRKTIERFYEELFKRLAPARQDYADSLEDLRSAMLAVAIYVRDNRRVLLAVVREVLNGNPIMAAYAPAILQEELRRISLLVSTGQRQRRVRRIPLASAVLVLFAGVLAPMVMLEGALEAVPLRALPGVGPLVREAMSDAGIRHRVDAVLHGLAASPASSAWKKRKASVRRAGAQGAQPRHPQREQSMKLRRGTA